MNNFLHLSAAVNLGLHAGMVLAREPEKKYATGDIAEELDVSYDHLVKVLQRLHKDGIVDSTRGPKGGFCLARQAQKIRLLDIYQAIEGKFKISKCLFGRRPCQSSKCVMGDLLHSVSKQMYDYLNETKLADLV